MVELDEILLRIGLVYFYIVYCFVNGDIMVLCMGDKEGNFKGFGFLFFDLNFNVKGRYVVYFFVFEF